ncbi:MAG: 4Fe-4S binding protein [Prolixibacteraceae bacterium]|nr:4Fe-4S binding protein [Prolixibacteraceae bacterium]
MRGRRSRHNQFQQRTSCAEDELCICSGCGYSTIHVKGRPCRNFLCPVCHVPLTRSQNNSHSAISNSGKAKSKTFTPPKVNTELCTGCGNCVEVCPVEAISLTDGRAIIEEIKCTNCRICANECPVGAIY